MQICVLGGGVVGVTTAFMLARCGYEVTILDKNAGVGLETSFANGGQLSYSYVAPLANKAVLGQLPGWLIRSDSPLRFVPGFDAAQWCWCMAFLLACNSRRSLQSTAELLELGAYSRAELHRLIESESIGFDFRRNGKLVIYRDAHEWDEARQQIEYQASHGSSQQILSSNECVEREPTLVDLGSKILGGIFTESEDVGDCYKFTTALARIGQERYGLKIHSGVDVTGFRIEKNKVRAVISKIGEIEAEDFVVALGNGSRPLLRQLGLGLPLYPIKGYSLTLPIEPYHTPPSISITDLHYKIVYARLGEYVRVAGMADLGKVRAEPRMALLAQQAQATFPNAADYTRIKTWCGARPTTPDSKPIISATKYKNLWLNTGHGSLGFTFACASASLVLALINHTPPGLDLNAYKMNRFFGVKVK